MLYGKSSSSSQVRKILNKADANGDGKVTFDEWLLLSGKHGVLTRPAFELQAKLRSCILGVFEHTQVVVAEAHVLRALTRVHAGRRVVLDQHHEIPGAVL